MIFNKGIYYNMKKLLEKLKKSDKLTKIIITELLIIILCIICIFILYRLNEIKYNNWIKEHPVKQEEHNYSGNLPGGFK